MSDSKYLLMALEPLLQGDWLGQARLVVEKAGFSAHQKKNSLLVWQETHRKDGLIYTDGFCLERLWLAKGRWALSLCDKRIYFLQNGKTVDPRPEYLITSDRPESEDVDRQAIKHFSLLSVLKDGLRCRPVQLNDIAGDLTTARQVWIGDDVHISPPISLNNIYRQCGFDTTPSGFGITICALDGVDKSVLDDFAKRLKNSFGCNQPSAPA